MDEDQGISSSLPPFLAKTYEMVDDLSTDAIVSWSSSDKSFIVWNPPEFSRDLLPKFFKHNNFSSFIRQLNTYGFRKVDPEQWEFANEDFIRGQPHLMKNIHRRKPVHSHSLQNIHGQRLNPLTDAERQSYKDDIERLKRDKDALILRLQTHEHERQVQIQALKEKMQQMEKRQQTMVSYVARVLQKPWLPLNLLPPSEGHERKRRLPRTDCFNDEVCIEDDQPATSQAREDVDGSSVVLFNKDRFEQLESSLTFWEDIVRGQNNLPLEFDESTSCAESQAISCGQLNTELRPKSPVIDMNSELRPKSPVIDMNSEPSAAGPTEQVTKQEQAVETVPAPATGANDVFWEQFLTENPGSNDNQEVQSERKDSGGKRDEIKPNDLGKVWWNMSNVNNLAEQMGQLTPAERT